MSTWSIAYDDGARDDIFAIFDHIAKDSVINADKAIERLESRILSLSRFPERGRVVPELQWVGITDISEVFEKPWRILYQFAHGEVRVMAVYDGRRRLDDVVLERFLR